MSAVKRGDIEKVKKLKKSPEVKKMKGEPHPAGRPAGPGSQCSSCRHRYEGSGCGHCRPLREAIGIFDGDVDDLTMIAPGVVGARGSVVLRELL